MLPDLPIVAEQGFTKFSAIQLWSWCAPAKTPKLVVTQLNKVFNDALALPEIKTRLHEISAEPTPISPGQFASFLKAEKAKQTQPVRDTNSQIEQ